MNITDYVKNTSREDRTQHIDLSTPCQDAYYQQNNQHGKVGDIVFSISGQKNRAKENLKDFLNISGNTNSKIHTCHLCTSKTKHGGKCVNPKHLYFGTARENQYDKPEITRKERVRQNGLIALKNGNHICQQILTCPHCQKNGPGLPMKRWHFDNCKYKV